MNLQVKLAFEGNLQGFGDNVHKALAIGVGIAAQRMAQRAVLALREDTRAGGLGDRVAKAWRANVYPVAKPTRTLNPSALVYSKAPLIVQAFAESTTLVAKNARFMAIPTENTPRKGRRYASPVEVEAMFNQDLILIHGRGQQILAFVDVVKGKSGKGFRRATKRRSAAGRQSEMILMFVMVRQVHLQKRLNWPEIFKEMQSEWGSVLGEEVEKALAD